MFVILTGMLNNLLYNDIKILLKKIQIEDVEFNELRQF